MKINSLRVPAGLNGLEAFTMDRLDDVVLLAGPNGGGKTRILRLISRFSEVDGGNDYLEIWRNTQMVRAAIKRGEDHPSAPRLASWEQQLEAYGEIEWGHELTRPPRAIDVSLAAVSHVPTPTTSFGDYDSRVSSLRGLGLRDQLIPQGVETLHRLLHQSALANSTSAIASTAEKGAVDASVRRLNELAHELLGSKFDFHFSEGTRLFDLPIGQAQLSRGQIILLGVLIAQMFQNPNGDDFLFVWDEPELHLHPSSVIDVIERLRSTYRGSQFWLATHSVHLLSHFGERPMWYVRKGAARRAGRNPYEVLASLVGNESGLEQLRDFLRLPPIRSILSFASQCLSPPTVTEFSSSDPQLIQIREVLLSHVVPGRPLRILDFGAGKCRLLDELAAIAEREGVPLEEMFDYVAYDWSDDAGSGPDSATRQTAIETLRRAYGDEGESRYLVGSYAALGRHKGAFDVVMLCNSLHEIGVEHWPELFGSEGVFFETLDENGHLFVVEDYLLAAGERAHQYGFLLLDEPELKELLDDDGCVRTWNHTGERFVHRLRTHAISKRLLGRYSEGGRKRAIVGLRDRAWERVQILHGSSPDPTSAREFAFWTHQFVNARMAANALSLEEGAQ